MTYAFIVASELWFEYRKHFVLTTQALAAQPEKSSFDNLRMHFFKLLTLGAMDISNEAIQKDHNAVKKLATLGIPVACFLHGYAGFIFGSVKANALWMTPLMPVIFICSAVVSGIALCILCYVLTMEIRKFMAKRKISRWAKDPSAPSVEELQSAENQEIQVVSNYLLYFMIAAITLEILDLIFRGYTQMKSWDILREVILERDFNKIFIMQYAIGNALPFLLMILPGRTVKRTTVATVLVMFGVFMMRWNVVIGGQAFSLSFAGFMHYHLPILPTSWETFREGLFGALTVMATPFVDFLVPEQNLPGIPQGRGSSLNQGYKQLHKEAALDRGRPLFMAGKPKICLTQRRKATGVKGGGWVRGGDWGLGAGREKRIKHRVMKGDRMISVPLLSLNLS